MRRSRLVLSTAALVVPLHGVAVPADDTAIVSRAMGPKDVTSNWSGLGEADRC